MINWREIRKKRKKLFPREETKSVKLSSRRPRSCLPLSPQIGCTVSNPLLSSSLCIGGLSFFCSRARFRSWLSFFCSRARFRSLYGFCIEDPEIRKGNMMNDWSTFYGDTSSKFCIEMNSFWYNILCSRNYSVFCIGTALIGPHEAIKELSRASFVHPELFSISMIFGWIFEWFPIREFYSSVL